MRTAIGARYSASPEKAIARRPRPLDEHRIKADPDRFHGWLQQRIRRAASGPDWCERPVPSGAARAGDNASKVADAHRCLAYRAGCARRLRQSLSTVQGLEI